MLKFDKIHCLGIGGIGVSALAQLFLSQGKIVTGSDLVESSITQDLEKQGITISPLGDADLIIYSDAVPQDNPERIAARERGIPEMSYAQALGELSKEYKTIVVTGTHGKSTTAAMLGLILEKAGLDPLVVLGTRVPNWKHGNLRLGGGEFLVVEGDDYRDHFLELSPHAVVVTNIEFDHPDYFKDLDHTIESFGKLVGKSNMVLLNKDDKGCLRLEGIRYGKVDFSLLVPGEFNQYNAGAAAACARELGVGEDVVKQTLSEFKGVWRRFEIVGDFNGAIVVSDYGHHPSAIGATMKAAREAYPGKRLVLVYQPHQHSRTKRLFNDFVSVLSNSADVIILSEIYAVKGRMEDHDVNSKDLADEIGAQYGGDLEKTEQVVRDTIQPGDVVIVMGAGDIDQVARNLV